MVNQTASERAGINGRNQSLEIYAHVLEVRAKTFFAWMQENYPDLTHMDESNWDDQYQAWLELDSRA